MEHTTSIKKAKDVLLFRLALKKKSNILLTFYVLSPDCAKDGNWMHFNRFTF